MGLFALKVIKEIDTLTPELKIINAGKRTRQANASISSLRVSSVVTDPGEPVDVVELERATKRVYLWLKLPQTPTRAVLSILGSGGVFYAAQVQERTMRAYVECGAGGTFEHFLAAVKARVDPPSDAAGGDDAGAVDETAGLFL